MSATRSELLAERLEEVFLSGGWIANTNYKVQIEGLIWKEATQKVEHLNTIAALTFHLNYYLNGILNVFDGSELLIRDKYSYDAPNIDSEIEWKKLVNDFVLNAEKFAHAVRKIPDQKLDETFIDEKYGTYLRNIEGVIEHSYYHLGQISLIRKLILKN